MRTLLIILTVISVMNVEADLDPLHPEPQIQGLGAKRYKRSLMERKEEKSEEEGKEEKEDEAFWMARNEKALSDALEKLNKTRMGVAKNVIIFVGDGMSLATVTAARIYAAQKRNADYARPESSMLNMEQLDHLGLSKTYSVDHTTPDSASTATAMFTGVKTRQRTLGFDSAIDRSDPSSMSRAKKLKSLLALAQERGKASGVVSTARITHATPAALYAHTYDRNFECDSAFNKNHSDLVNKKDSDLIRDIAWQLVNRSPGNETNVIMGGGFPAFYPINLKEELEKDLEYDELWDRCYRRDKLNLISEWMRNKPSSKTQVVRTRENLKLVDVDKTDYLFGLFGASHLNYDDKRREKQDPSLAEMTEIAIKILRRKETGFFLMVEAGRIDHAHHASQATRALSETLALDDAVAKALELVDLDETLVVVTADHAHTMTIAGYPQRGNDITGLSGSEGDDGLPYTTLSYANGPGFYRELMVNDDKMSVSRRDLRDVDVKSFDYVQTAAVPRSSETHGAEDVPIFASGPWSHLFHSTHEQTFIAEVAMFSACLGRHKERCPNSGLTVVPTASLLLGLAATLVFVR